MAGDEVQTYFQRYDATHRPITVASLMRQHLDQKGHVARQEHYGQKMTSWDLLYHVLRANFDGNACGYVPVPDPVPGEGNATYEYGNTVRSVVDRAEQVEVLYRDAAGEERTTSADLVLAADGPGSTIRSLLMPGLERRYAGYVAWRGTVPESEASTLLQSTFVDKFTFYHGPGTQILA